MHDELGYLRREIDAIRAERDNLRGLVLRAGEELRLSGCNCNPEWECKDGFSNRSECQRLYIGGLLDEIRQATKI